MVQAVTKILDHGTANPIVARLTVQIFAILEHCEIAPDTRDGIKVIYMNCLAKKLLRCGEILERYRFEFTKQMAAYKRPPADAQVVKIPHVLRLDEECHNFLYEAKNFVRDLLKVFNILYGTTFVEASEYLWPKKGKGKQSLIGFAELTFGADDPKTRPRRGSSFEQNTSGVCSSTSDSGFSVFAQAAIRFSSSTFGPGALLLSRSTITRSKGNGAEHRSIRSTNQRGGPSGVGPGKRRQMPWIVVGPANGKPHLRA
jgi:hypothetical protein